MNSGIGDIHMLEIRRDFNTIGSNGVVGNCLDDTSVGFETISLVLDDGSRAEVLPVSVRDIGEPEIAGDGVLLDIVDGCEVAAEEVVDEDSGLVCRGIYQDQLSRIDEITLIAEDDLLAFTAVEGSAHWVEGRAAVCFG